MKDCQSTSVPALFSTDVSDCLVMGIMGEREYLLGADGTTTADDDIDRARKNGLGETYEEKTGEKTEAVPVLRVATALET